MGEGPVCSQPTVKPLDSMFMLHPSMPLTPSSGDSADAWGIALGRKRTLTLYDSCVTICLCCNSSAKGVQNQLGSAQSEDLIDGHFCALRGVVH